MNGHDVSGVCHRVGGAIEQTANMAGHGTYTHDTQRGKTRAHTRVKAADPKSRNQERKYRTLATWAARERSGYFG